MAQVKIVYRLSEAGRKASLLAGGDGRELQVVTVAATPELIALATVRPDGSAWIYATTISAEQRIACGESKEDVHGCQLPGLAQSYEIYGNGTVAPGNPISRIDVPPADAAAWVLELSAENAARRAAAEEAGRPRREQLAADAEAAKLRLAKLVAAWMANPSWRVTRGYDRAEIWVEGTGTLNVPDNYSPEFAAEVQRRLDLAKAREDAEKAEKIAAAAAAEAERAAWIRAHGSARLRKCLDMGMIDTCAGVYRSERLAHDFPGWVIDNRETEEESEIRNPSIEALAALEEARKIDRAAKLVKVRPATRDDDGYDWREAVRIDDLPGITSSKVFYRLI